jgi:hypothetical protein
MISLDYNLIAEAQRLAGKDVHALANILCKYQGSHFAINKGHEDLLDLFEASERELRAFVAKKKLNEFSAFFLKSVEV